MVARAPCAAIGPDAGARLHATGAVVDPAGTLIYYEKADNTQLGSARVAIDKALTSLGTGEALVSVLNPKGVPTPVAITQIVAPSSAMTALDEGGYQQALSASALAPKYSTAIDRESAH